MHYELWALNTANLVGDYDTEPEALAMVRDLLAAGWSAEDLGLALELDEGEAEDDASLPPAIHGGELAAHALASEASTPIEDARPRRPA